MTWPVAILVATNLVVIAALFWLLRTMRLALAGARPADAALRERLDQLEAIAEALPEPLLVVDRELRTLSEFSPRVGSFQNRQLQELAPEQMAELKRRVQAVIDERHPEHYRVTLGERRYAIEAAPLPLKAFAVGAAVLSVREVTAQAHSDETIRRMATRNHAVLRSAMDGFFVVGEDQRFIEVNDAFCRMVGYNAGELLERKLSDLEVIDLPGARLSAQARTGLNHFVTAHRHRDGHIVHLENSVTVLRDEGRKFLVGFVRDVTARCRAEEALRESEQRYRALFEDSRDAIYITARDGWIIDVNPAFLKLFGGSRSDLIGTNVQNRYADAADRERLLREIEGGGVTDFPVQLRRLDGTVMCCRLTASARRDRSGQLLGYQGIVRDVTEQVRAESELRRRTQQYRELVETSHDLIWSVDLDGRYTFVNQAALRIFGRSPDEMIGRPFTDFMTPEQAQRDLPVFEQIKRGTPRFFHHTEHLRKDGQPVALSFNALPLRDEQGRICGTTGTASDITELKRADAERRRLELQFHESQKRESLGMLAGGVAHDFNNFLVGVLCNVSLAIEKIEHDREVRPHLQKVLNASRRASELTRLMLAYSGQPSVDARPLDLSSLVNEMGDFLRAALPKTVALQLEVAPELPLILADSGQIQQIIMNLLINAAEAMNGKPGTVLLRTQRRTMDERSLRLEFPDQALAPGEFVCLQVSDTGCGMSPDTLARIFDPFFTTKFTGRGLGLAALLGIVRGHGGAVRVESRVNQGTTFSVLLPAQTGKPPRATLASEPPTTLRPGTTVLVVDDEEDIREVVQTILVRQGLRVFTAASGQAGVELFRTHAHEIDLVLLDLTMPGMSGEQVLAELLRIDPQARIVLSTGYNEREAGARFEYKLLAGFVQKPYTAEVLVAQLARAMRNGPPSTRTNGAEPDGRDSRAAAQPLTAPLR